MVLGVVGKIGSGKSYFLKYVKEKYHSFDIKVFSCDDVAKELLSAGNTSYKGKDIVPYEFFTNEELQEEIRKTLHPEVFNLIKARIEELKASIGDKNAIYIVESALPSELMYEFCDKVIYIKSSYINSYNRLKSTRGYTDSQIKLIFDLQKYYEKFYNMADYIIENDDDIKSFESHIDEVMNEICIICK